MGPNPLGPVAGGVYKKRTDIRHALCMAACPMAACIPYACLMAWDAYLMHPLKGSDCVTSCMVGRMHGIMNCMMKERDA